MGPVRILRIKAVKYGIGILFGGIAGYLYYTYYGCDGSCAITSDPTISSLYGSFIGAYIAGSIGKKKAPEKEKHL